MIQSTPNTYTLKQGIPTPNAFTHKIGGLTFNINVHFDDQATQTFEDKIKRLILAECDQCSNIMLND